jgi:hypothetical protein
MTAPDRPAWADENTAEWTLAERLRYDLEQVNTAHAWHIAPPWHAQPTGLYRAIITGLRDE